MKTARDSASLERCVDTNSLPDFAARLATETIDASRAGSVCSGCVRSATIADAEATPKSTGLTTTRLAA